MRNVSSYLCGSAMAGVMSLSLAASASAQSAPVAAADSAPGEIVVTAQKRPELLSKAAISISAITGASLRSAGVTDALTLTNVIPSAQITQANGLQITIRGVSSVDGTEKGDPSAAFMINGIYVARQQSLSGSFFDLARVEVLRGPQGTLYGRNATAGVVNVIANRPSDKLEANVNGEIGNYGTYRADGMVNVPVTDTLAIRAAGSFNKHDSYLKNGTGQNNKLGNDQDEAAGRLSALWKFGGSKQGSVYVVGDYSHQGGVGTQPTAIQSYFNNALTTNPVYNNAGDDAHRTVTYPSASQAHQNNRVYGITGELNYDFGGVGLTYLGAYRVYDRDLVRTQAYPKAGVYPDEHITSTNESQSHELRLATTGHGPVDLVGGLYYFREETKHMTDYLVNYSGYSLYGFLFPSVVGESKAAFGQATWHITPRLRLTGGIRYSHDLKSRVGTTFTQNSGYTVDPSTYSVIAVNNARATFSKVTWKAGVDYDVSNRIMAYATVSTGYKAGGFNDGCAAGTPSCLTPTTPSRLYYQPETITAYEAGLKGRYLDGTLSLNLTGFYYDYSNLQLTSQQEAPAPAGSLTLNAAKANIKGGEIEAIITPSKLDRFDISAAFLDARYGSYKPNLTTSWAGRVLDNSPSATIVLGYTRTQPLASGAKIAAHVDTRYSASYVVSDFNIPAQYRQPDFTKTNVTLTYTAPHDRWYLQAYAKNLENTITFSGYQSGRVYIAEPRTFGLRAGVKY